MSDLYPTPTRRSLLVDVDAGEVWLEADGGSVLTDRHHFGVSDPIAAVTARIGEAETAGWVARPDGPDKLWQLTDAGRAVLDQHRRADA